MEGSKAVLKAAAIRYDPAEAAPKVTASGSGETAALIVALAKEAGVEIREDAALAGLLSAVKPGEFVPEWCWEAAAKLLSFVLQEKERSQE